MGTKFIVKNVNIWQEDRSFEAGTLYVENQRFVQPFAEAEAETVMDGNGCYAIPGLIDLHFHGCNGYDICDGTKEALGKIAEYELSVGVTTIAPATMTLPVPELVQILQTAAEYQAEEASSEKLRAEIKGINMEGPFISPVKRGAQDAKNIIPCDVTVAEQFLDASKGLVKFMGIAPEESENSLAFIREMKDKVTISLAHTNADYETAYAAFENGARHAVHMYNAMPSFLHREPGVVGAVADSEQVVAELICDGIHLHPAVVRTTLKMLGAERVILVSDSMRATGLEDGTYTLGGLDVNVCGKRATLVENGSLAGSVTNLMGCLKTVALEMKVPFATAVGCATANPAKSLGIFDEYGSIAPGKFADFLLLDADLNLIRVCKKGTVSL